MPRYDYIIVGSGIAGLYTALLARQLGSVLILTKGTIEETNTRYAQGGIAAAIGPEDSPDLHFQDTMDAGAGLCDPEAARILVGEAADRIQDLIDFGVLFDTVHGEVALTREGAHSQPRILHAGGDATGEQIEITLSRLAQLSRITVLENVLATRIVMEGGVAKGVGTLDTRTNLEGSYEGRFIILATGGCGRLFQFTTNSTVATGDGVALAYEAGAEIRDMEFYQFHPTALRIPGAPPFLISEAVRGEGAILRNKDGYAFAADYDARAELAPRDIVTRAMLSEMQLREAESVFLDMTHLPARATAARFPTIYRTCLDHGIDITRDWIPVSPAAHYMMGGVTINTLGETTVPGLFACGETTCSGVHGANRLASNSLLEVLIIGKRLIERTQAAVEGRAEMQGIPSGQWSLLPRRSIRRTLPPLSPGALQRLMWQHVGIVREGAELEAAAATLAGWADDVGEATDAASHELRTTIVAARLMVEPALLRTESRGAHFRSDFPQPSEAWLRHILYRQQRD